MKTENLIPVDDIINSHSIELSFLYSLKDSGLIELVKIEQSQFLLIEQVPEIEKMIRLHYELDINIEGIETIFHLLNQISELNQELLNLRNKAALFDQH